MASQSGQSSQSSPVAVKGLRESTTELFGSVFQPDGMTRERAEGTIPFDSISRSYGLMRLLVGILGLALPLILVVGDGLFLEGAFSTRGSLSEYYHSGMRDAFVGILMVTGMLLVTYKISERGWDNRFSFVAGLAAIVVALFPTHRPDGDGIALTPLQDFFGESFTAAIHYGSAAVFIVALGCVCVRFALREREKAKYTSRRPTKISPYDWYRFHFWAAVLIFVAAAFIVVTQWLGILDEYSILIGELVVTIAFGSSWLAKGADRNMLPVKTSIG